MDAQRLVLHLYVFGQSQHSLRAVDNLRRLCEQRLDDDYELVLIDVQAQPELAEAAQVFATPVTIRIAPPPALRVVGDLSDPFKVLQALGLEHRGNEHAGDDHADSTPPARAQQEQPREH